MRDLFYLFWVWMKEYSNWFISGIILFVILYFLSLSLKDRNVIIEGHEYIERHYYRNTELIHNPECKKCNP